MKRLFILLALVIGLLGAPVVLAQDTVTPTAVPIIEVTAAATDVAVPPVVINVNTDLPATTTTNLNQVKDLIGEAVNANNPALLAVIVVLVIIVIFMGSGITYGLHLVFKHLLPYQQDALRAAEPRVNQEILDRLNAIEKLTTLTPNPVDDYLVGVLKEKLPQMIKDIVATDPVVAAQLAASDATTVKAAAGAKVTVEPPVE